MKSKLKYLLLIMIVASCNFKDEKIIIYNVDEEILFPIGLNCKTIEESSFLKKVTVESKNFKEFLKKNEALICEVSKLYSDNEFEIRYKIKLGAKIYCFNKSHFEMEYISLITKIDSLIKLEKFEMLNMPQIPPILETK